jgi:hypothetical protein
MSDLPEPVERYLKSRDPDLSKIDHMPKLKKAFKDLKPHQLAAIDMLNDLGAALEDQTAGDPPDERLQKYIYAIH